MTLVLELAGISKSYGSLKVIDDLSVRLEAGEALGVVGPNGSGKTTMLNLAAGQLRPDTGRVLFDGEDVTALPARSRCRRGIARTYQIPQPFAGLTVYENVLVGATFGRREPAANLRGTCLEALSLADLERRANQPAGSLNLLDRKRLELARALATGPRVLLLDEIAGGLSELEIGSLVATVEGLHAAGMTIVWIEHIVHALLSVVDRMVAIDFGRKLIEGEPRAVMASPEVRDVYLGSEVEEP